MPGTVGRSIRLAGVSTVIVSRVHSITIRESDTRSEENKSDKLILIRTNHKQHLLRVL